MRMNKLETWAMNNPIRELSQRHFEAPRLLSMGGSVDGGLALEVGCGRGVGVEIIMDRFGASQVDAFDLDREMVERAHKRLRNRSGVRLWVGDVTKIESPDAHYDAVFDFGIIHHVLEWREALAEIYRVLAPGGRFFAEEVLRDIIVHPVCRWLLEHPQQDRFDANEFCRALTDTGFVSIRTRIHSTHLAWYVAEKPS